MSILATEFEISSYVLVSFIRVLVSELQNSPLTDHFSFSGSILLALFYGPVF